MKSESYSDTPEGEYGLKNEGGYSEKVDASLDTTPSGPSMKRSGPAAPEELAQELQEELDRLEGTGDDMPEAA